MEKLYQEEELEQILKDKWTNNNRKSYVNAKGCTLPEAYQIFQKEIDDFEVFDSDIWICSFPRTGTTWMSEMVWLLANNLNFEKAEDSMFDRIRFLDLCFLTYSQNPENQVSKALDDAISFTKNQPEPRFIKTHLPFQLLPKQIQNGKKQPKVIYICRNPMDACVSYYHHAASIMFTGGLEEFCQLFLAGKVVYGPFWEHILPFWEIKDRPNFLFLTYEDMKRDLDGVIRKTADFLGKKPSEDEIEKLQKHLSFESMKKNPAVSGGKILDLVKESGPVNTPFIRKGIVGGYKNEMPQDFIDIFDKWFKINVEGTGLTF